MIETSSRWERSETPCCWSKEPNGTSSASFTGLGSFLQHYLLLGTAWGRSLFVVDVVSDKDQPSLNAGPENRHGMLGPHYTADLKRAML